MATQITALPDPPSRADPVNFAAKGDAFLGALPNFAFEANFLASEAEQNALNAQNFSSDAQTAAANAFVAQVNAQNFAQIIDSEVPDFPGEYSAREWATGIFVPDGSAKEWAITVNSLVDATEYSAKEYASGTFVPTGSAKEWASQLSMTVDGTEYSAKEWAVGESVPAGSSKFWSAVSQVSAQFQGLYSATTTYQRGQTVTNELGVIYVSVVDNNIGNALDNLAFWVPIQFSSPLPFLSFLQSGGY